MGRDCGSSTCQVDTFEEMRKRLVAAEAEVERLRALERQDGIDRKTLLAFVAWVAKHPDVGDSLTAVEREEAIQAKAREVYSDVRVTPGGIPAEVHPGDAERTMAESHCSKCARCQAYKAMADDEAKRHGERAKSYREELMQIVSYLAHYDQDANHAWMVRRIRAVMLGKNPNLVEGWSMFDGVPEPKDPPAKVVGTSYPPPRELWFHFHPAPHVATPDGGERLAAGGDLWHEPFESKEEAVRELREESALQGWKVIGPFTYEERSAT